MDLEFTPLNRQKGIQKLYTQMQDFRYRISAQAKRERKVVLNLPI
jgi:hypothetical protein